MEPDNYNLIMKPGAISCFFCEIIQKFSREEYQSDSLRFIRNGLPWNFKASFVILYVTFNSRRINMLDQACRFLFVKYGRARYGEIRIRFLQLLAPLIKFICIQCAHVSTSSISHAYGSLFTKAHNMRVNNKGCALRSPHQQSTQFF